MSRLIEFGEIIIDYFDQTEVMGTGEAPSSLFGMIGGGSIDNYGSNPTYPSSKSRSKSMLIASSSGPILEKVVNQLKALRGVKDKLWREDAEGERQYTFARLISVDISRTTDESRSVLSSIQSVTLSFVCDVDTWLGEFAGAWTLNAGYKINNELKINSGEVISLTTSPQVEIIEITQDTLFSKKLIRGVKISVYAKSGSSFSTVTIANGVGSTLSFSATVAAGKVLVIDGETATVTNDGADAYDDLTITRSGDVPFSWFPLQLGENPITITHNGADGISFDYTEEHF